MKGRVIINYNICDNAPECGGIEVCPTGAFYWNEKKESIDYNQDACIDCGLCAENCPVEAILWAEDDDAYEKNKKAVEEETRRLEDLQVERYGAAPIDNELNFNQLDETIRNNEKYLLLEFYDDDSINCLLHSIRVDDIKQLFDEDVSYHKVLLSTDNCVEYNIDEKPSLVVYYGNSYLGTIKGYYTDDQEEEFFNKIRNLIGNNT